jgi:hypothetical protein
MGEGKKDSTVFFGGVIGGRGFHFVCWIVYCLLGFSFGELTFGRLFRMKGDVKGDEIKISAASVVIFLSRVA